jgi:hypothetical protein
MKLPLPATLFTIRGTGIEYIRATKYATMWLVHVASSSIVVVVVVVVVVVTLDHEPLLCTKQLSTVSKFKASRIDDNN